MQSFLFPSVVTNHTHWRREKFPKIWKIMISIFFFRLICSHCITSRHPALNNTTHDAMKIDTLRNLVFNQRILAKNEDVYRKLMFKFKHMYPLLRTDHPKSYKMSDMLWLRDKCKFVSLTANRTEQINVSQLKLWRHLWSQKKEEK